MDKQNQKTVYLLGAGASNGSDFGLPLMEGFFREEDFNNGNYPNLSKFIKKHFQKIPFCNLNLEEVITFLELSIDKFGSFGKIPETYLYEARREFEKYVVGRLKLDPGNKKCSKHLILAKNLNDGNSVISLNYDEIMQYTLWHTGDAEASLLSRSHRLLFPLGTAKIGGAVGPSPAPKNIESYFLQLHGSINWLYCPNPICWLHQSFYPTTCTPSQEYKEGNPCIYCGSPLSYVIVPPTMNKAFQKYPRLGIVWSLAYREIEEADKLVFIGLSLAESDYYLNWLIKSAVINSKKSKKIEVVNKCEKICEKIEKLIGTKPTFLGDFDEYIGKMRQ